VIEPKRPADKKDAFEWYCLECHHLVHRAESDDAGHIGVGERTQQPVVGGELLHVRARVVGEAVLPREVDDRILDSARELALRNPHLSPSFLERRLRIGVQKSAQVIELLEEEGLLIPNY